MIHRYISLFLVIVLSGMTAVHAADDPMKSLFLFQKQMADTGNSSAMMKLGQMYERGEGVKQSNANALKMYEKAKAAGHKGADSAIKRIKNAGNNSAKLQQMKEKKHQEALARKKAEEQKRKELAQKKAAEKQLKLQQAAKEKKAREKAAAEEAAKKRKVAKLKADRERADKIKAAKAAAAKAAADEAKAKKVRILAEQKRRKEQQAEAEKKTTSKGFKADPCKSPAARLMSICRNK